MCGLRHRTLAGRRGRRRPGPALKLVCAWRGKVRMACEEVGADERLQSQRMWRSVEYLFSIATCKRTSTLSPDSD